MPNHVSNKIKIVGTKEEISEVLDFVKTENSEFDFNRVEPMPKELKTTTAPSREPNTELIEKYGFDNWYDWSLKNWGTKWNAYDIEIEPNDDCQICFDTAWSSADIIIQKLSKQFPTIEFILTYADEDLGYNCGIVTYNKGKQTTYINKAIGNLDSDEESIRWAMIVKYGSDEIYEEIYLDNE